MRSYFKKLWSDFEKFRESDKERWKYGPGIATFCMTGSVALPNPPPKSKTATAEEDS